MIAWNATLTLSPARTEWTCTPTSKRCACHISSTKSAPASGCAKRGNGTTSRSPTPVHHGCTRDEQVRWLVEVWNACERERKRGADIRAVTLWSMFGAVDWRSLLTRKEGIYDVGAFDTRSEAPRPTLVAKAAAALGRGEKFDHP